MLIGTLLTAWAVKLLLGLIKNQAWGAVPMVAVQIIFLLRYDWICLWDKFLPMMANELHELKRRLRNDRKIRKNKP